MSARVIADSMNPGGQRITTLQLRYWRAVHAELLTHRSMSRNASSSRAIPVRKVLAQVWHDPAGPEHWGANQAGKIRPGLVLGGFARALKEVARVGTYGAQKYTENGWVLVPNGVDRYDDAMLRHWLDEHCGVELDKDTELRHAAHAAWNALARLDLVIRKSEEK